MSEHAADLTSVEAALKRLTPAASLDRDRLMFEAGRASRPRAWAWPSAAAALALLSAGLTAALMMSPPRVEERIVYVPTPPEGPTPTPPVEVASRAFADYHRLQEQILLHGLDALPASEPTAAPARGLDRLFGEPGS